MIQREPPVRQNPVRAVLVPSAALATRPQVLLLDEPLSALDAKIRVELRNEIRRIQRQLAITTIYVTHDQEEALSLSDRSVDLFNERLLAVPQVGEEVYVVFAPHACWMVEGEI